MRYFCTYFDAAYIWKGLALYESLKSVSDDFCLYVMALDKKTFDFLLRYQCDSLKIEYVGCIETEQLLKLKAERTRAEYCWTCGPVIILHFLTDYQLPDITYLDSDLMFFSSFEPLFEEIGECSVGITPQFSNRDDVTGKYCVQYVFFRNDTNGLSCLRWWRDQCLDWCYARYENGKFGDQKYLDYFPEKFNGVVALQNRGAGIGPWNMYLYKYSDSQVLFDGHSFPIIFFHFHGMSMDMKEDTLIFKFLDCNYSPIYEQVFFQPYQQLLVRVLHHYFNIHVDKCVIRKKSFIARTYSKMKHQLRNVSVIQRIYFALHRHEGWENSKL